METLFYSIIYYPLSIYSILLILMSTVTYSNYVMFLFCFYVVSLQFDNMTSGNSTLLHNSII